VTEPHLPTAIEQAEALQDRLVRVAYGLHFSCENIASLMEQRGDLHRVSRTDYACEAKRWREAGTQALDLVRTWGHAHVPELAPSHQGEVDLTPRRAAAELADDVMHTLYTATLRVDSFMSDSDDHVRIRLREVAELLETSIRQVRRVIIDLTEAVGPLAAE
jgi:hypothetical protein